MSVTTVRVAHRFRGPATSGNGGYVAGLLARTLGGSDCVVTLRKPIPLDQELQLRPEGDEVSLLDADELIATAARAQIDLQVPQPPSLVEAHQASSVFTGFRDHPVPECFVCGTAREDGDALRIFPGRLGDSETVAAPWHPHAELADSAGECRTEYVWAALDCAGFFSAQGRVERAILGRIAASIARPVPTEETLIVTGWPIASEGRKHHVGTALHDASGQLLGAAQATWIAI